jgi:hypothetical protein
MERWKDAGIELRAEYNYNSRVVRHEKSISYRAGMGAVSSGEMDLQSRSGGSRARKGGFKLEIMAERRGSDAEVPCSGARLDFVVDTQEKASEVIRLRRRATHDQGDFRKEGSTQNEKRGLFDMQGAHAEERMYGQGKK